MPTLPRTHFRVTSNTIDAALRYRAAFDLLEGRLRPGVRLLEVGSGAGGAAEWIDAEIVGIDTAFDRTAERARPNLIQRQGSVTAIPEPDASFDAVVCLDMLEHVPAGDRPQAITELIRVLAPGGRLILSFPAGGTAEELGGWLPAGHSRPDGEPPPRGGGDNGPGVPPADPNPTLARPPRGTGPTH